MSSVIDDIHQSLDNVGGNGGSLNSVGAMGGAYKEAANFAIQVKRLSANIAAEVPYVLFGWAFVQSGYYYKTL
jgi:hypothetical protein